MKYTTNRPDNVARAVFDRRTVKATVSVAECSTPGERTKKPDACLQVGVPSTSYLIPLEVNESEPVL